MSDQLLCRHSQLDLLHLPDWRPQLWSLMIVQRQVGMPSMVVAIRMNMNIKTRKCQMPTARRPLNSADLSFLLSYVEIAEPAAEELRCLFVYDLFNFGNDVEAYDTVSLACFALSS